MDVSALKAAIARDRDAGRTPFCISANAGTTNTGTIDPLPELAQIANDEGLWYHVDAAYGGFFQLTKWGRERLTGIEHADSVVLDPHKGLFVPFGTGCLLVRREEVLRHSHSGGDAPYLHNIHELGGDDVYLPDFADLSPELTRPNRVPLPTSSRYPGRGGLRYKRDGQLCQCIPARVSLHYNHSGKTNRAYRHIEPSNYSENYRRSSRCDPHLRLTACSPRTRIRI